MNENSNNFTPNSTPEPPKNGSSFNAVPNPDRTQFAGYAQQPPINNYSNPNRPVQPAMGQTAPTAQPSQAAPTAQTKTKKSKAKKATKKNGSGSNKGFTVFIALSLVMSTLAVILCLFSPQLEGLMSKVSNTHEPGSDDTQIQIQNAPDFSSESSLSTISIAENAEKINVGIMLYGKTQSFFYESSSSLIGEGSGIVMSVDKTNTYTYILTCAHVISDASSSGCSIVVQDSDGNTYDGIMVGYDVKTDIGIIKIATTGLTAAQFGDSTSLKKGQRVYAIGNPGGMEFFGSFTDGMISSIDRPISSEGGYEMNCIQHTTPINSGNSGGALLNEFGQVIGINSSKIVSTGYEGMAFAIPIKDAEPIINDLIANGHVTNRPKLGISYTVAREYQQFAMIIKQNNLPAGSLVIRDINPDSSLASTNAEVNDLIIAVDGTELDTPDILLEKIENGKVGDELTLTICRIDPNDYSVSKFDVKVKLVADTGTTS